MEEDEIDLAFACFTAALTLLALGVLVWLLAGCSKPAAAGSTPPRPPVPTSEYSVETRPLSVVPTAYPAPSPTPAPTLPDGRPESAVDDLMVNAKPATSAPPTPVPVVSVVTEAKGEPPMEGVRTKGVAAVTTTVAVVKATPAPALVALPAVELSPASEQLIIDQEVGGGAAYYNKFLIHPEWPEGDSGCTIGVGSDLSTLSVANIRSDWHALPAPDLTRLVATQPYHGIPAKAATARVHDISVPWPIGLDVFDDVDVPRFYQLTRRTFPGFDDLKPNAQGALTSLVFNRGESMVGSKRIQMRAIRDLVPKKDYRGMADQLRAMIPLWLGQSIYQDMKTRRNAEADLMETCAQ